MTTERDSHTTLADEMKIIRAPIIPADARERSFDDILWDMLNNGERPFNTREYWKGDKIHQVFCHKEKDLVSPVVVGRYATHDDAENRAFELNARMLRAILARES